MSELLSYFDSDRDSYEYTIRVALKQDLDADSILDCMEKCMLKYEVVDIEYVGTTPWQKSNKHFPNFNNVKVATIRVATEYPVTDNMLRNAAAKSMGITNSQISVKKDYDPSTDDEESLLYGVASDDYEPLLGSEGYSEHEDAEEELHGEKFLEQSREDIKSGSKERKSTIRKWKGPLMPDQELDREEDDDLHTDSDSKSVLTDVYKNSDSDFTNHNGLESPFTRIK